MNYPRFAELIAGWSIVRLTRLCPPITILKAPKFIFTEHSLISQSNGQSLSNKQYHLISTSFRHFDLHIVILMPPDPSGTWSVLIGDLSRSTCVLRLSTRATDSIHLFLIVHGLLWIPITLASPQWVPLGLNLFSSRMREQRNCFAFWQYSLS